jgi:hypothetical protein
MEEFLNKNFQLLCISSSYFLTINMHWYEWSWLGLFTEILYSCESEQNHINAWKLSKECISKDENIANFSTNSNNGVKDLQYFPCCGK